MATNPPKARAPPANTAAAGPLAAAGTSLCSNDCNGGG